MKESDYFINLRKICTKITFFLEKRLFLRYHRGVKNLTQRRVKNVNYY